MKHAYFLACLGLLGLTTTASAQTTLTNNGAQLTVGSGATLYISGGFENRSGSTLLNNGTVQVTGSVTNAGTVDGTGTLNLNGTSNQTVTPGGASFYNVTVDNSTGSGSAVTLAGDLTVTNQLTLTNGLVNTTSAYKVALGASANLTGEDAGRYVQGVLESRRTGVNGSANVLLPGGVTLNPGSNNLGTVVVTRKAGLETPNVSYGTNGGLKGIDRIWQITASGTQPDATKPVTVTLTWTADNDNTNGLTQMRVYRATAAAGPWVTQQAPVSATGRSISSPADALGFFTVSSISNPLPVELLDFTAERRGADALLRWATAMEKNNARFEVEVSTDGQKFDRIGTRTGQGTSTSRHDYEYADERIARYAASVLYYRLRQVDTDGKETLSPIRTVRVEGVGFAAQAVPNPFGNEGLQVQVLTQQAGPATFDLHDAVGRVLLSGKAELPVGGATLDLRSAGQLPVGVYILTVRQGKQVVNLKVVRN